eukprot:s2405_g4.t1
MRRRSRSPAPDSLATYSRARAAGLRRGGPKQKRRLKSACLGLLESLLRIFAQIETHSGFLPPEIERRKGIAIGIHNRIRKGWLPGKWEPLLPSAEDSDLESNLAESIWLGDCEEEEEDLDTPSTAGGATDRPPTPPLPPRLVPKEPGQPPPSRSVPQEPRYPPPKSHSSMPFIRPAALPHTPRPTSSGSGRVTEPAPLLRSQANARPKSATPVIDLESPTPDDLIHWSTLRRKGFSLFNNQGVEIKPRWKLWADRSTLVSIDFHNVLDLSRTSLREVERPPREGQIAPTNLRVLSKLAQRFTVVVTSFVHTDWRKERADQRIQQLLGVIDNQSQQLERQRVEQEGLATQIATLQSQITMLKHSAPVMPVTQERNATVDVLELKGVIDTLRSEIRQLQQPKIASVPIATPPQYSSEYGSPLSACAGYPDPAKGHPKGTGKGKRGKGSPKEPPKAPHPKSKAQGPPPKAKSKTEPGRPTVKCLFYPNCTRHEGAPAAKAGPKGPAPKAATAKAAIATVIATSTTHGAEAVRSNMSLMSKTLQLAMYPFRGLFAVIATLSSLISPESEAVAKPDGGLQLIAAPSTGSPLLGGPVVVHKTETAYVASASSQTSVELEWIADSGASRFLASVRSLTSQGLSENSVHTCVMPASAINFETGNGTTRSTEQFPVHGSKFGTYEHWILDDCPIARSLGEVVSKGLPFIWMPGELPYFAENADSVKIKCKGQRLFADRVEENVPIFKETVQLTDNIPRACQHVMVPSPLALAAREESTVDAAVAEPADADSEDGDEEPLNRMQRYDEGPKSHKGVYYVLDYQKVKNQEAGYANSIAVPFQEIFVEEGPAKLPVRVAAEEALASFKDPSLEHVTPLDIPFSSVTSENVTRRNEYITLDRIIRFGPTVGCKACAFSSEHSIHSPICRARFNALIRANRVATGTKTPATLPRRQLSVWMQTLYQNVPLLAMSKMKKDKVQMIFRSVQEFRRDTPRQRL